MQPRGRPITLGFAQYRAQRREAAGTGKGGEEQAIGPQGPPHERERAGQIVDAVEHPGRHDEIERRVGKAWLVLIGLDAARRSGEA
eukprot:gene32378-43258_t